MACYGVHGLVTCGHLVLFNGGVEDGGLLKVEVQPEWGGRQSLGSCPWGLAQGMLQLFLDRAEQVGKKAHQDQAMPCCLGLSISIGFRMWIWMIERSERPL